MRTIAKKRPLSAGQVAALLLLAATLMMWWSVRGDEENCTMYGASPQFVTPSTIGQAPIGCIR